MSHYDWESGTIVIPSGQWAAFRTGLIKAWNDKQGELLVLAEKAHKAATDAAKGKRGKERQDAMEQAVAQACGGKINQWGGFEANSTPSYWRESYPDQEVSDRHHAVSRLVFKREGWGKDQTIELQAPKKKDLAVYPTSKGCTIRMIDANVIFDNDRKSVTWEVHENNHAVESARSHWFAKKLFSALDKVDWKRNSGGQIVGNDEYHRDDDSAGGGANYVTVTYGPKSKRGRDIGEVFMSRFYR